jgi:hypothetical protein
MSRSSPVKTRFTSKFQATKKNKTNILKRT